MLAARHLFPVQVSLYIYTCTINVLKFRTPKFLTKWPMQTVKEQSDQILHCFPFHLLFQETIHQKQK